MTFVFGAPGPLNPKFGRPVEATGRGVVAAGLGWGAGTAERLILGGGILAAAGVLSAALTISGVRSLLLCATVTSLREL